MQVDLKYQINEKIKTAEKLYTVIGFEIVIGRGMRYVLAHQKDGKCEWEYMYEFEIEALKEI